MASQSSMGDLPYQGNACFSVKNGQLFSVELIGYRQREEGFDSSGNTVVEELQKEKNCWTSRKETNRQINAMLNWPILKETNTIIDNG